jgi:hypothetical protein
MGMLERNTITYRRIQDLPMSYTNKTNHRKKRLRRSSHRLRTSESKRLLNPEIQGLKQLISNKNDIIQTFLQGLTPTESTDYSLWKRTKKIKRVKKYFAPLSTPQRIWARTNIEIAHAFAEHIAKVFRPHPSEN